MPSSPRISLSPTLLPPLRFGRGTALLCLVAALTFFVTGSGMLEGHAVYPSWRTLAAFEGFAGYHAEYGLALLPFLPLPLLLSTIGTGWLIFRRPAGVPRSLVIAALCCQLVVLIVTAVLAIPIQAELATPGHSPDEIVALVDRLIAISYLRELPGLAVAGGFVVMLVLAIRGRAR
ncbi:MAG: hypothetical protein ABWZ98_16750 [Nakamurella sp.]